MVKEGEEKFIELVEGEEKLFSEVKYGDQLMGVPLHSKLYHIRDIEGWNLIPRYEGILILTGRENM